MSDNFSTGVKTLLARMESNPDEFRGYGGKWHEIIEGVYARKAEQVPQSWMAVALTDEEVDAIYAKHTQVRRMELDEWVMKKVLHGDESKMERHEYQVKVAPRPPTTYASREAQMLKALQEHREEQRRSLMAQGIPIK